MTEKSDRGTQFILLILLSFSCASQKPERKIASIPKINKAFKVPGIMDRQKSLVQIFPAVAADSGIWYFFYIQLKDSKGHFVDCDPSDLSLKTTKGKEIPFKYERLFTGRYYLTIEKTVEFNSGQLDFFIKGKPLNEQFQLSMRQPDRTKSTIKILRNEHNEITFQLRLNDSSNAPVDTPDRPEILLEGLGSVENVKHISEGVWEFSVIYPEENQIMYFSIRAQGVYLGKLFRYQHVEK